MGTRELNRLRKIVLALPEVNERVSHGAPCFFIRDKQPICYFHDHHNRHNRVTMWCPVYPDAREEMVRDHPERFFKPPMSASGTFSDWLGVFLDTSGKSKVDWDQIAAILKDAFRKVASKKLIIELESR